MNDSRVLFCPFCREPFEGLARCPTHDLALVGFRELPPETDAADDEPLALRSLARGRGPVLLAALISSIAFFLPLARLSGAAELSNTLSELASGRAPRLWIVPAAALAALSVLLRRRTPTGMRGARLALAMLALLPSAVVAFTLWGASDAAQAMGLRLGGQVRLHVGVGAWLVFAAAPIWLWGALRFGVAPARRVR